MEDLSYVCFLVTRFTWSDIVRDVFARFLEKKEVGTYRWIDAVKPSWGPSVLVAESAAFSQEFIQEFLTQNPGIEQNGIKLFVADSERGYGWEPVETQAAPIGAAKRQPTLI